MSNKNGESIFRLLKEINSLFHKKLKDTISRYGLTVPQILVTRLLKDNGAMKISDIGSNLNMADSTVSGIVDRLEAAGLVERVRVKEDRRHVNVILTKKIDDVMKHFESDLDMHFTELLSTTPPEESELIIDALEKLKKLLKK